MDLACFFFAVQSNKCRRQLEEQEGLHLREDLEHQRLCPDPDPAPDHSEPTLERRSEQARQELSSGVRSCQTSFAKVSYHESQDGPINLFKVPSTSRIKVL